FGARDEARCAADRTEGAHWRIDAARRAQLRAGEPGIVMRGHAVIVSGEVKGNYWMGGSTSPTGPSDSRGQKVRSGTSLPMPRRWALAIAAMVNSCASNAASGTSSPLASSAATVAARVEPAPL